MCQNKVQFSIVIPVYNRSTLIVETIDSVLKQSFNNYEIIIINDGSNDNTLQVLSQFNNKILLINQENQGAEIARNAGVKIASGEYVVFLDSDDILLPHALFCYNNLIIQTDYPAFVLANGTGFKQSEELNSFNRYRNEPVFYTYYKDFFSKKEAVWLSTSFIVIRRSLWSIDTEFRNGTFPVDDLDFVLRVGTLSSFIKMKSPVTVGYRYHGGNSINDIKKNIQKIHDLLDYERKCEVIA
ncbi:MAG: glycosyltransferase family 2 protein [Fibrobacter sp.]|nr:glycosyltransferase family 2 protein [Fibrobacter sp.]